MSLDKTILVHKTTTNKIICLLGTTANRQAMLMHQCSTEQRSQPVCIFITVCRVTIISITYVFVCKERVFTIQFLSQVIPLHVLSTVHELRQCSSMRQSQRAFVINTCLTFRTTLSSYQNNTTRSLHTINRTSRSIFQNSYRFYVIRVNLPHRTFYTVYQHQRTIIALISRTTTH